MTDIIQLWYQAMGRVLGRRLRMEVWDSVGMIGKNVRMEMRLRHNRKIGVEIHIPDNEVALSMNPEKITSLYFEEGIASIIKKLSDDTAQMEDLRDSWWKRLRFLFKI